MYKNFINIKTDYYSVFSFSQTQHFTKSVMQYRLLYSQKLILIY